MNDASSGVHSESHADAERQAIAESSVALARYIVGRWPQTEEATPGTPRLTYVIGGSLAANLYGLGERFTSLDAGALPNVSSLDEIVIPQATREALQKGIRLIGDVDIIPVTLDQSNSRNLSHRKTIHPANFPTRVGRALKAPYGFLKFDVSDPDVTPLDSVLRVSIQGTDILLPSLDSFFLQRVLQVKNQRELKPGQTYNDFMLFYTVGRQLYSEQALAARTYARLLDEHKKADSEIPTVTSGGQRVAKFGHHPKGGVQHLLADETVPDGVKSFFQEVVNYDAAQEAPILQ